MSWLDKDLISTRLIDLTSNVTGVLPSANGGTGLSAVGSNGSVLTVVAGAPAWATPGSGSYQVLATVVDSAHTVSEYTSGVIVVPFSGLTLSRVLTLPDALAVGTVMIAGTIDNSLTDVNTIVWTPQSGNISKANISAATFTQKQSDFPLNSNATFYKKTSTLWVAL